MIRTMMLAALLGSVAMTGAASAQQQGGVQCTGKSTTIRMSLIKAGKLDLFKKAVADHQAWYKAKGSGTTVSFVRQIKGGQGAASWDDSMAMTIVVYDTSKPRAEQDDAYKAFVKEYADSSTLKDEHRGCMY